MSRRVVDNYRYLAPSSSEISPVAGPLIRRRSKMTFDTIHSTCLFCMPIPLKLKAAPFTLSPHSTFGGIAWGQVVKSKDACSYNHVNLWYTKWHWNRVSPSPLVFLDNSVSPMLHIYSPIIWVMSNGSVSDPVSEKRSLAVSKE